MMAATWAYPRLPHRSGMQQGLGLIELQVQGRHALHLNKRRPGRSVSFDMIDVGRQAGRQAGGWVGRQG